LPIVSRSRRNRARFEAIAMEPLKTCDSETPAALTFPRTAVGTHVTVRARTWRLDRATPWDDCTELELRSADGRSAVLLWPFDRPVPCRSSDRIDVVRPRTWLRRMARLAARPGLGALHARCSPRLRVLPYQLAPALCAAAGYARIFLADEVGLGKTVQAGWIAADACARRHDARILIVLPAGLRLQWQRELARHFGMDAVVADAPWLRRAAADLPPDVNPWSLPGVYITSVDFVKREDVGRGLASLDWDVLIADEAHGAAAPTDRHAALDAIGRRAPTVVLISATPYAADASGFASLTRIGGSAPPMVLFRRSRQDAGLARPRRHRFAAIRPSVSERRLHALLDRYTRAVWHDRGATDERARLAMIVLRKRALSSALAAAASIARRMALLDQRAPGPVQLPLFDEDEAIEDAEPVAALAAPGLADADRERCWLTAIHEAARDAARDETKIRALQRLLRRLPSEPVVVFTEYRDTLARLAAALGVTRLLHGGMTIAERDAVQRTFNDEGGVLIASDAAAEGLNLQARCRLVINFELPWNPARLDQRIGRVDRLGQSRRVHAMTLVFRDTAEDLVLAGFLKRLMRAARTLGDADRVAALLTEARAAQAVIGGTPLDPPEEVPAGDIDRSVAAEFEAAATAEARRLHVHSEFTSHDEIVVTHIRRSRSLRRGTIFVIEWTADAPDGTTIASRAHAVFVPKVPPIERRAPDVRASAQRVLAEWMPEVQRAIAPAADQWLADAREKYGAIAERLAERERVLAGVPDRAAPVQAGLFDRRALTEADALSADLRARADTHLQRHEALLTSAARMTGSWRIAGVCFVVEGYQPVKG
jgi:superfamily II DNA or RNA helicase